MALYCVRNRLSDEQRIRLGLDPNTVRKGAFFDARTRVHAQVGLFPRTQDGTYKE